MQLKSQLRSKLPRGMRLRVQRSGAIFYYYEPPLSQQRQEVALGSDFQLALLQRARILMNFENIDSHKLSDFWFCSNIYLEVNIPTQEPHTQRENRKCIEYLQKYFEVHQLPLSTETINNNCAAYAAWRGEATPIRSGREWSLLRVILKWVSALEI